MAAQCARAITSDTLPLCELQRGYIQTQELEIQDVATRRLGPRIPLRPPLCAVIPGMQKCLEFEVLLVIT